VLDHLSSVRELKTRPPTLPPGLVPRPELIARLTSAAELPVTLVCAGPGAGKTSTVASWVASRPVRSPIGWLSLDSSDNDPPMFWSNVITAVLSSGAVPATNSLREMALTTVFGPTELLTVMDRLAQLPIPVVLVLDDVHEITNAAVVESLGYLVDHLPPSLRLVLVSRADPVLRLHRLRVAGQLTDIRTQALSFSEMETAELFRGAGLPLDAGQVTTLRNRTEGWPAGLRMAAMSLDPRDVQGGIDRFSGTDRAVADYLIGEVTRVLPAADRDFLLATSVVDRVTGPLADQLTGRSDGHQVLERFVEANTFVVGLGQDRRWFRFHPLLLELMRHRLALERPAWKIELHRRAAAWLTEHADLIEATRHWIAAGEERQAGRTLVAAIPKMLTPQGPALAAAVAPLAASALHTPSLESLLAAATWHFHRREYQMMRRDAAAAEEYLDTADPEVRPTIEVVLGLFRMVGYRAAGDSVRAATAARTIMDLVDAAPRGLPPAGRAYRVMAQVNLAGAQIWSDESADLVGGGSSDDTHSLDRLLNQGAADADELGLPLVRLNAHSHLAVLEAMRGQRRAADHRTAQLFSVAERHGWGSEPQILAALLARALVDLARQRPAAAGALLQRGLTASRGETDRSVRLAMGVTAVLVAVAQSDPVAARAAGQRLAAGLDRTPAVPPVLRRWAAVAAAEVLLLDADPEGAIDRIGEPIDAPGFVAAWERVCLARAYLALERYGKAETVIGPLLAPSTPAFREPAIAGWLVRAVLATRRRRDSVAMTAASTALDLAQPESIRRPFLMIGPPLTPVLLRYQTVGTRHNHFAAELLGAMTPDRDQTHDDPVIVSQLTEREIAVLQYLPTMLKAGEIATELTVSVNTVKAHLRSLYRKLAVANRREAVNRARTLGLL
jgi:LuxR family maltose regulon positive regulatory protein